MPILIAILGAAGLLSAQAGGEIRLANGKIEVQISTHGGGITSVVLVDDPSKLNPLWEPADVRFGSVRGHFVCLDGFGQPSAEERAAGFPSHGEAVRTKFEIVSRSDDSLTLVATLPLAQERVTRTYRLPPRQNALSVRTRVESLLAIDRPMAWAEHATIGAPFLERGVTEVQLSGRRSQTRPWKERGPRRLASGGSFEWPNAPLADGGRVDLTRPPAESDSRDHTTTLLDPSREHAFVTAVNPRSGLLVGWLWTTSDFPWMQNWEFYPKSGVLARGLEFSTQPYDIPRREAVAMNSLFGAPTFRWLPAHSTIETEFVLFYTRVPKGFSGVTDVQVADTAIRVSAAKGSAIELPFAITEQ